MPIHSLFPTFFTSVRIRRQRNANEFLIVSSINILMSKSGSCPGDFATAKRRSWLDQLRAADFLVAAGSQTCLDKFAPVVKKKSRIPVYGHALLCRLATCFRTETCNLLVTINRSRAICFGASEQKIAALGSKTGFDQVPISVVMRSSCVTFQASADLISVVFARLLLARWSRLLQPVKPTQRAEVVGNGVCFLGAGIDDPVGDCLPVHWRGETRGAFE